MKYRDIYACWVLTEVENGVVVSVLDRELRTVKTVNEMTVDRAVAVIKSAEENRDRYVFWAVEEEVVENA
jgi:hypothetical protein